MNQQSFPQLMLLETPSRVFKILFCKAITTGRRLFPANPKLMISVYDLSRMDKVPQVRCEKGNKHPIVGFENIINDNGDKIRVHFRIKQPGSL